MLLAVLPLILIAGYLILESVAQTNEASIGVKVIDFVDYLYAEQPIFLILVTILVATIPLLIIAANARSTAYINMGKQGFEYKLPLLAGAVSNGFCPTCKEVRRSEVVSVRVYQGTRLQVKGIKGMPSSRLDTAKIEIITDDFRLYLNPYKWLEAGQSDHRLSIKARWLQVRVQLIQPLNCAR